MLQLVNDGDSINMADDEISDFLDKTSRAIDVPLHHCVYS